MIQLLLRRDLSAEFSEVGGRGKVTISFQLAEETHNPTPLIRALTAASYS